VDRDQGFDRGRSAAVSTGALTGAPIEHERRSLLDHLGTCRRMLGLVLRRSVERRAFLWAAQLRIAVPLSPLVCWIERRAFQSTSAVRPHRPLARGAFKGDCDPGSAIGLQPRGRRSLRTLGRGASVRRKPRTGRHGPSISSNVADGNA
jgi:hypothetical protein